METEFLVHPASHVRGLEPSEIRPGDERPASPDREGGTDPAPETPAEVAAAQRQLKVLQWVIPALTGGVVVLNALHGEQQRPNQQFPGIVQGAGQLVRATD